MTTLRLLQESDLPAVEQIEQGSFSSPFSHTQLQNEIIHPRGLALGLFTPELAGFAFFRTLLDEAELIQIAISPSQRGAGLGLALLQTALPQLQSRGVTRLMLEVRRSNQAAIALYHRLGFIEEGCRKGYYPAESPGQPPEDALLMGLTLSGD